jgi:hypothetical protein
MDFNFNMLNSNYLQSVLAPVGCVDNNQTISIVSCRAKEIGDVIPNAQYLAPGYTVALGPDAYVVSSSFYIENLEHRAT